MPGFRITLIAKSYSHFCHFDALFYMNYQQLGKTNCCKETKRHKRNTIKFIHCLIRTVWELLLLSNLIVVPLQSLRIG